MPGRQRLPRPWLASIGFFRRWYARRLERFARDARRFDPALRRRLEGLLLPADWGHVDFDGDGVHDAFRIALTNNGPDQRITGVRVSVDGVIANGADVRVDNAFAAFRADNVGRVRYEPGAPFLINMLGVPLSPGVHSVSLRLIGEIEDVHLEGLPVIVERDSVVPGFAMRAVADVDPRGRSVHVIPFAELGAIGALTPPQAAQAGMAILLEALRVCAANPRYRFTFGDAAAVDELEVRRPDAFVELRRLVTAGRVEPVCSGMAGVDPATLSGEALVRHVTAWQRYAHARFGRASRTAWWTGSAAMIPQMPQVLLKAGIDKLVTVPPDGERLPAFFWLRGPDNARIATHALVLGPGAAYPVHREAERTLERWRSLVAQAAPRSAAPWLAWQQSVAALRRFVSEQRVNLLRRLGREPKQQRAAGTSPSPKGAPKPSAPPIPLALGGPFARPQAEADEAVRLWNERYDAAPMRLATPAELFDHTERSDAPTVDARSASRAAGVRTPGGAPDLTRLSRRAESAILDLETFATLRDDPRRAESLRQETARIWREYLTAPTAHLGEKAAAESARRLDKLRREAHDASSWWLRELVAPPQDGPRASRRVLVANPLGFFRQEAAEAWVEARDGALPVLHDGAHILPTQVLEQENYADGGVKRARVAFLAHVPPCGWRTFDLASSAEGLSPPNRRFFARAEIDVIENGFVRVEIDPRDGSLRSIWDRRHDRNFALQNAGRPGPGPGAWWSRLWAKDRPRVREAVVIENGPVRAAILFRCLWRGEPASLTYRLTQGSRHLEILLDLPRGDDPSPVEIDFPAGLRRPTFSVETAFGSGVVGRGGAVSAGFARLHDGRRGLVFLHDGMPVWRSRRRTAWVAAPRGPLDDAGALRYGLYPHVGPVSKDYAARRAQAFNRPMTVLGPFPALDGTRPASHSVVRVDPANVVLSSLRDTGAGLELRVFETAGIGGALRLFPPRWAMSAAVTDLLGRVAKRYLTDGRSLSLPIGPYEIKTILLSRD